MAIKAGRQLTFTLALKSGQEIITVPDNATVTARLYSADGVTPLSSVIPMLSTAIGANWSLGVVVADIPALETTLVTAPQCAIVVVVTIGGASRNWITYVEVDASSTDESALFQRAVSVSRFRAERLRNVQPYLGGSVSDDYIWAKLLAAESDAQRELHVFLRPTVLFPNDPTQAEIDALAGAPWAVDPGYDYEQDMIQPGGWTFLKLRQRPVITLESIKYAYPSVGAIFSVPEKWIKIDKKYGHIRFFPAGNGFNTPVGGVMIGAMGMQGVPQFIEVRYTAGLKNAAADYPDLLDVVQRIAALRMMNDAMLSASTSISADGLSQSKSAPDLDKLQAGVDKLLDTLRQRIHGVPLMVL